MKFKKLLGAGLLASVLALGVGAGLAVRSESKEARAEISSTVTKVYVEDQVNSNTTLLSIESISFDTANGYGHSQWRDFLTSYLGERSSYETSKDSPQPNTKGWSYMSDTEQEKYLLCPTGSKNFTMIFPEWVTAFSYKAVGNNFNNWFDVGGSAVSVHGSWGIGKKLRDYIYNDYGWKMNVNLDDITQTNDWGDITVTARAIKAGTTTEIANKSITMSKYYKISGQTYNELFGYTFGGWYTTNALTTEHTALLTGDATVYAKETAKTEAYLSGTMNDWDADDPNYLMEPGSDSQYVIHKTLTKDTEFKVVYLGSNWYGWSQVDQTSKVIQNGYIVQGNDPDTTGFRIKVTVTAKYEIYLKTTAESNKIWIQQDSESEAAAFATEFLATITCTSESTTFAISKWNKIGSATDNMEYKFSQLTNGAQGILKAADAKEGGTIVEQCAARYNRILSKYGTGTGDNQYHNFMERTVTPLANGRIIFGMFGSTDNSTPIMLVVIISVVSLTAVGGYIFLKRRKEN